MATGITKPMLAATFNGDWDALTWPQYGTYKLDGIRALKISTNVVSRTFKPIANKYIRETLNTILPEVIS